MQGLIDARGLEIGHEIARCGADRRDFYGYARTEAHKQCKSRKSARGYLNFLRAETIEIGLCQIGNFACDFVDLRRIGFYHSDFAVFVFFYLEQLVVGKSVV